MAIHLTGPSRKAEGVLLSSWPRCRSRSGDGILGARQQRSEPATLCRTEGAVWTRRRLLFFIQARSSAAPVAPPPASALRAAFRQDRVRLRLEGRICAE